MINIRLPDKEKRIIDAYAKQEGRSLTEIIREFIRSLEPKLEGSGGISCRTPERVTKISAG